VTGRRIETLQAKRPLDVTVFDTATVQAIVLGCSDLQTYALLAADQARELARALNEAADLLEPRGGVIPPVVPALDRRDEVRLPPATPREDGVMFRVVDSTPRDEYHGAMTEGLRA
jgi:hypothetical protein